MARNTCAACDGELDADPVRITVGGKTVEVCCDECAVRLKESGVTARTPESKSK